MVVVKNGHGLFGHGTLKAAVSQEWIDEVSWFFACWYKYKVKVTLIIIWWVELKAGDV